MGNEIGCIKWLCVPADWEQQSGCDETTTRKLTSVEEQRQEWGDVWRDEE